MGVFPLIDAKHFKGCHKLETFKFVTEPMDSNSFNSATYYR